MENIIFITGKVNFTITLDPGVWVFDERKIKLTQAFFSNNERTHEVEYVKKASQTWEQTRKQGAASPIEKTNKITIDRKNLLENRFGIPLKPFLENAEPAEDATQVIFETTTGDEFQVSLAEAADGILGFLEKGSPLNNGPVHFYFGDGRNFKEPFCNINKIVLK